MQINSVLLFAPTSQCFMLLYARLRFQLHYKSNPHRFGSSSLHFAAASNSLKNLFITSRAYLFR